MTSTARDIRYGRRGGGWAEAPVDLPDDLPPRKGGHVDMAALFHPETIARTRAHADPDTRTLHRCATRDDPDAACDCPPHLGQLDNVWAGRARMAAARRDAGMPLDQADRHALTRTENPR